MYYTDEEKLCCNMYFEYIAYSLFDINHPNYRSNDLPEYTGVLYHIECFVDSVLSYPKESLDEFLEKTEHLHKRFNHQIPDYLDVISILSKNIDYSERIQTFVSCLQAQGMNWNAITSFQILISDIRRLWEYQGLQNQITINKHNAKKRYQDYERYVKTLLELSPKLQPLELRLYYRPDLLDIKTVQDASHDLNKLFRSRRNNSVFRGMQGYIAKLSYNPRNGIHCHLILFYDDIKTNHFHYSHLVRYLIDYWKNTITNGEGGDPVYENVEVDEIKFPRLILVEQKSSVPVVQTPIVKAIQMMQVGVVQKEKSAKYPDLFLLIELLCHVDRFIKPKGSAGIKLIRRGAYPTKKKQI